MEPKAPTNKYVEKVLHNYYYLSVLGHLKPLEVLGRIAFFPDLCWNMTDVGSLLETKSKQKYGKMKQESIPEKYRNHVDQEMQNVVISFALLQNMRFQWSQSFMKHEANLSIKIKQSRPKTDFKKQ